MTKISSLHPVVPPFRVMTKRTMSPRKKRTRGCSPGGSWSPTGTVTRTRRRRSAMTTRPPSEGRTSTSCWPPPVRPPLGPGLGIFSKFESGNFIDLSLMLRRAHSPLSPIRLFFQSKCLSAVFDCCARTLPSRICKPCSYLPSLACQCCACLQQFAFHLKRCAPSKGSFCVLAKPTVKVNRRVAERRLMRIAFVPFVVTFARMPIHPRRADGCEYFRDVTTESMWTMCLPQMNESGVSSPCCSSYLLLYFCVHVLR